MSVIRQVPVSGDALLETLVEGEDGAIYGGGGDGVYVCPDALPQILLICPRIREVLPQFVRQFSLRYAPHILYGVEVRGVGRPLTPREMRHVPLSQLLQRLNRRVDASAILHQQRSPSGMSRTMTFVRRQKMCGQSRDVVRGVDASARTRAVSSERHSTPEPNANSSPHMTLC